MQLTIVREIFMAQATIGRLFIDGEFFCYTSEKQVRPAGVRVEGSVAIPEGSYKASVGSSTVVSRQRGTPTRLLGLHGVQGFAGVRVVGAGTNSDFIEGTITVGSSHTLTKGLVKDSVETQLIERIGKDFEGVVTVVNCTTLLYPALGADDKYSAVLDRIYGNHPLLA